MQSDQGIHRVQVCLIWVSKWVLALEHGLPMPRWKSWAIPQPAADRGSWLLLIRKPVWENLGVAWNRPSQSCPGRSQIVPPAAQHGPHPIWQREHLEAMLSSNSWAKKWVNRADCSQSQASGPVWPQNFGAWISLSQYHNKEHYWLSSCCLRCTQAGKLVRRLTLLNTAFNRPNQGNLPEHTGSYTAPNGTV